MKATLSSFSAYGGGRGVSGWTQATTTNATTESDFGN
jgi:hypothetical protein